MSHTPHDLHDIFPQAREALHDLKMSNPHFARLESDYGELNKLIHRVETDVEPMADYAIEDLKKRRLALLDEISSLLHPA
ncbi:MAG: YdcH family protein [Pikeienuella sp.]